MKKNFELIEKYFSNSLNDEEQIVFNNLLKNDPAFKEEFLFKKDLKKALSHNQRNSLKTTLQKFESDIDKEKVFPLRKWMAAASIVLVLGFSYFLLSDSFNNSSEKLYAEYFEPYRNIVHPVVRGENGNNIESSAFLAYENRKFYKAINLFNSVSNKEDEYIRFYTAMCHLGLNDNLEAINLLLPIATNETNDNSNLNFKEKANWYLGLAYLNSGDINKAISQFSVVANNPEKSYKKEEAQEILDKLDF